MTWLIFKFELIDLQISLAELFFRKMQWIFLFWWSSIDDECDDLIINNVDGDDCNHFVFLLVEQRKKKKWMKEYELIVPEKRFR